MTKDYTPRGGWRGAAAREGTQRNEPLDRLRDEIDAVAAEPAPSPEQSASIAGWLDEIARSGVLRRVPLSPVAMDVLAQLIPPASVTAECHARLERERFAQRAEMLAAHELDAHCRAASPAELFRDLRERAGLTAEHSADLFGITPASWIAVEMKERPWYQLPANAVPAFAAAVREPVDRLLALIALTARRALYEGVDRRANLALGRFDDVQGVKEARRDTVRVAFARVQDENRGAAAFLKVARRAAGEAARAGTAPETGRREEDGK